MNAAILKLTPQQIEEAANDSADPVAVVNAALARFTKDKTAIFDDVVIDALKTIRRKNEAEYLRLVANAKGCKTALDKLTRTEGGNQNDSYHDLILNVAKNAASFTHDANDKAFALIEVDSHREVWPINSTGFDRWLRGQVYSAHKTGIPDQAMRTALATLDAVATFEGEKIETNSRCAKANGGYYIDLCDEEWRAAYVSADGYEVLPCPPVYFTRATGARALPTPSGAGNVDLLWQHVNISPDDRSLVLAWLLEACRPDTPYPVLELAGEQGSSKSTTQKRLRALIDPHDVPLRTRPKTTEDIFIAASNAHVVSYENLSHLSVEHQDALCILATGGGFATRQLYSNGAESVMASKKPVVLNGINTIATRPDLVERTLSIELPTIKPEGRKQEQTLETAWEQDYPEIFAGLITLFSVALRLLPTVKPPAAKAGRMLDFQLLGEAVTLSRGGKAGSFTERFSRMNADGAIRALESFGISTALQAYLAQQRTLTTKGKSKPSFEGTPLQLLSILNIMPGLDRSNWPTSPRNLSSQLKRLAPGLRHLGIEIEHGLRTAKGSTLRIWMK